MVQALKKHYPWLLAAVLLGTPATAAFLREFDYLVSTSTHPAATGSERLANNTDTISWRNASNGADLPLTVNSSNQLSFNGTGFLDSTPRLLSGAFPALTGDVTTSAGAVATTAAATQNNITSIPNLATVGTISSGTWSGTAVGPTKGGTNQTTWTLGDLLYSDASNSLAKLAGNITGTKKFLTQTGTGSVSAAPGWNTIVDGDLPSSMATKTFTGVTTFPGTSSIDGSGNETLGGTLTVNGTSTSTMGGNVIMTQAGNPVLKLVSTTNAAGPTEEISFENTQASYANYNWVIANNFNTNGNLDVISSASPNLTNYTTSILSLKGSNGAVFLNRTESTPLTVTPATNGILCINSSGQIGANSGNTCAVSLKQFKTDIQKMAPEESLKTVLGLSNLAVYYRYKDDYLGSGKRFKHAKDHMPGFIAEEVEKLDPRYAIYNSGELSSVNYPQMSATLTSAISALVDRLDKQKKEIDELKALIKKGAK